MSLHDNECEGSTEPFCRCSYRADIARLEQQLAAAQAAIKVKDAFLHTVTTEIRWSGDPMYEAACKALAAAKQKE